MSVKVRRIRKTIRIGGKRVSQYFRTRALADEWYRKMLDQRDMARAGIEPDEQEVTLLEFAKAYIARRARSKGHNVWVNDEQRLRTYILPLFKDRALCSITATEWKTLFESVVVEQGKSKATSNQVRAIASKMYNEAIEQTILKDNPIRRVKPYNLKRGRVRKIKDHFWQDLSDLVAYLEAARDEEPGFYVFKFIECNTGLRRSQIVPLQWRDVNEQLKVISVERSYMASNDSIREGSKGFAAGEDYVVGINDALWEVLQWWKGRTAYAGLQDYICVQSKKAGNAGKHFYSWHLKKAHERIIKRVNQERVDRSLEDGSKADVLKRIKPHGIRHTYATHYLESGGTLEGLQRMLGHKDVSTTQIYTHVIPKALQQKANIMNVRVSLTDESAKRLSPQCHQIEKRGKRNKVG